MNLLLSRSIQKAIGKSVTLVCLKVQKGLKDAFYYTTYYLWKTQENVVTTRSGFVICSYFRDGASPAIEMWKRYHLSIEGKGKKYFSVQNGIHERVRPPAGASP